MLEYLFNIFIKRRLQHRCFPVKFAKFLRTPFFREHSGGSFLLMSCLRFFAPQCSEIYSSLFDIFSYIYKFMSCVVASLKCFVNALLLLPNNSHAFTSLTRKSMKSVIVNVVIMSEDFSDSDF